MKKGIIVLLIAVLVAGFAFAGTLKGDATIKFGINLDEKTFGFENSTTVKYNFKFEFDTTKVEVGEHQTELWAEIAATASASVSVKDSAAIAHNQEAKITKANIHVGEWTFGILNAGAAVDYAKSYYTKDGAAVNDVVKGGEKLAPGFTVAYQGWRGGFGFKGNWAGESFVYNVFAHGETKAFKFGENEEFALQAGAYIHYYNEKLVGADPKNFGAAAKLTYAADKLSADAAADLKLEREEGANTFTFEAAANATYKIENGSFGVNVYGTNNVAKVDSKAKYADGKGVKLDAKVWAKYDFDFNGTKLATEAHFEVKDIINGEREYEVYAKETLTILDGKLALAFSEMYGFISVDLFDDYKLNAYGFEFTAKATYTADKFTANAGIDNLTIGKLAVGEDSITVLLVEASCGISSTKIIENAEIGLTYKGLSFIKLFVEGDNTSATEKGKIEAYAKIAF